MLITKRLTIENVNLDDDSELDAFDDQVITAGLERVRAEGDELRRSGILDAQGNVLLKELPVDMKEGGDRDFGGWRLSPEWSLLPGRQAPVNHQYSLSLISPTTCSTRTTVLPS